MKILTLIQRRDPAAIKQFIQTCIDCGATGVSLFTRPEFVQPISVPGTQSEADLQAHADAAAAVKNYREAARIQEQIESLRTDRAAQQKTGAQWIIDEMEPIKGIAALLVVGNLHWPAEIAFTTANFFSRMEGLSAALLSTGIGGIVQRVPLRDRTFIPLAGGVSGNAAQGEPASGSVSPLETPVAPPAIARHASIPTSLSEKQAKYAEYRLGLDRGGQRRSKQEASNLLGYSPNIGAKMENSVVANWPLFLAKINENAQTV